jgi:hypothetical protein
MTEELLKEMYQSVEKVNELYRDEELTLEARDILIREEKTKQAKLKIFLDEWRSK